MHLSVIYSTRAWYAPWRKTTRKVCVHCGTHEVIPTIGTGETLTWNERLSRLMMRRRTHVSKHAVADKTNAAYSTGYAATPASESTELAMEWEG